MGLARRWALDHCLHFHQSPAELQLAQEVQMWQLVRA